MCQQNMIRVWCRFCGEISRYRAYGEKVPSIRGGGRQCNGNCRGSSFEYVRDLSHPGDQPDDEECDDCRRQRLEHRRLERQRLQQQRSGQRRLEPRRTTNRLEQRPDDRGMHTIRDLDLAPANMQPDRSASGRGMRVIVGLESPPIQPAIMHGGRRQRDHPQRSNFGYLSRYQVRGGGALVWRRDLTPDYASSEAYSHQNAAGRLDLEDLRQNPRTDLEWTSPLTSDSYQSSGPGRRQQESSDEESESGSPQRGEPEVEPSTLETTGNAPLEDEESEDEPSVSTTTGNAPLEDEETESETSEEEESEESESEDEKSEDDEDDEDNEESEDEASDHEQEPDADGPVYDQPQPLDLVNHSPSGRREPFMGYTGPMDDLSL